MPATALDPRDLSVSPLRAFLVQVVCWNLALFGLLRLSWIDRHAIGALVEFQKSLVLWYGATPSPAIVVNSSCSGADVMALCAGVILAYPAAWRRRLAGAAAGLLLVLGLNAVRIASLYAVAADRAMLNLLHLYVWPALLTAAVLAYVLLWIRSDGRGFTSTRWMRFAGLAAAGLAVYAAAAPWVLTSRTVHEAGVWTAAAGGAVLTALGAPVRTAGNVLVTGRGAFQVTQDCLVTPVLPLYLAAVFSLPLTWRRRLWWLALAVPIFFALGVARLLVLALPASIAASPLFLAHGFYQIVTGAVLIVAAAHLTAGRRGGWSASVRTAAAAGVALVTAAAAAPLWTAVLVRAAGAVQAVAPTTLTDLTPAGDHQGALALMPGFQVALLAGLWCASGGGRRPWRLAAGLMVLGVSQVAFLVGAGYAATVIGDLHALVIRGWAVAVPLLIALGWHTAGGTTESDPAYRRFWADVGEEFPSLAGAASTELYFRDEQRLIAAALPSLEGCTLLKTDLWDEAKNTRILQWAADRGARVFGIDLSEPIVRQARDAFGQRPLRPVVSDVRRVPFADASFDAIYSMGTIEHFAESEASVAELARLLRPGGRLILGVPNRHDPFLRPLMVAVLGRLGLYAYGYEKSYSRRALRRMLEQAGLEVRMESGILFMPGWLRMLDLWCHTRAHPLAAATAALVRPFAWISRRFPQISRYGYLIASVGEKPAFRFVPAGGGAPAGPRLEIAATTTPPVAAVQSGVEFVVDARGCPRDALESLPRLQRLFAEVLDDLRLHPVAPPVWHVFPGQGGITGMVLLSESHLTIHTYPETGAAALNLYCCRGNADWPWEGRLRTLLEARDVEVRVLRRG